MTATIVSFRWLDLLEKEFDKSYVDLELIIGDIEDIEEGEWISHVRTKLGALSSCFAQLAHKAQTIFQTNAKLEAELLNLRHELAELGANNNIFKEENHDMLMQLHASQLKLHNFSPNNDVYDVNDTERIRERLEKELELERTKRLSLEVPKEELVLLKRENEMLKKHVLNLQGELTGAKLTSKYLDKELAGRIQQLQLLSRELKGEQHEKLWRQLEAEIHLHRHKTVVRVCRNNITQFPMDTKNNVNGGYILPKPPKSQQHRIVSIYKSPEQGLGMSITGGREHGVPILISVLHNQLPAGACQQLFVGDAILSVNGQSLKDCSHSEAVDILSSVEGEITLEVVFVCPDDDDEASISLDDPLSFRYRLFDDEVASVTSSLHLLQNGRLSRASIDSIRGSTDNILESPRRLIESSVETSDVVEAENEEYDLTVNSEDVSSSLECRSFPKRKSFNIDHRNGDISRSSVDDDDEDGEVNVVENCLSENISSEVCEENDESEDTAETPEMETSQLIASVNSDKFDSEESRKLIKNVQIEKPSLPSDSLTSEDVFNSNY